MLDPARYRFEVRVVDQIKRVYTFVEDHPTFVVAVLCADSRRASSDDHFVVYDSRFKNIVYDSRKLARKDPPPSGPMIAGD